MKTRFHTNGLDFDSEPGGGEWEVLNMEDRVLEDDERFYIPPAIAIQRISNTIAKRNREEDDKIEMQTFLKKVRPEILKASAEGKFSCTIAEHPKTAPTITSLLEDKGYTVTWNDICDKRQFCTISWKEF